MAPALDTLKTVDNSELPTSENIAKNETMHSRKVEDGIKDALLVLRSTLTTVDPVEEAWGETNRESRCDEKKRTSRPSRSGPRLHRVFKKDHSMVFECLVVWQTRK